MKKYVFVAVLFAVTLGYSQNKQENKKGEEAYDVSELVTKSDYYGLSITQREKLIARKKTIGREYAAIGRDRNLSGYEKGVKKRELSLRIQEDIRAILNEEQYDKWSNYTTYQHKNKSINEEIELQLERLEKEYEQDIKRIERQYKNDKYTLKNEKNKRKVAYKTEKERLKSQKI